MRWQDTERQQDSYTISPKYSDRLSWAKSIDTDQMLHSAVSDLSLYCLLLVPLVLDTWKGCVVDLSNFESRCRNISDKYSSHAVPTVTRFFPNYQQILTNWHRVLENYFKPAMSFYTALMNTPNTFSQVRLALSPFFHDEDSTKHNNWRGICCSLSHLEPAKPSGGKFFSFTIAQFLEKQQTHVLLRQLPVNRPRHAKEMSSGICWPRRPSSACASAQSDQGLHCPQIELWILQNVWKTRMILCACAGWSESAHFAHVQRHVFAWHGQNGDKLLHAFCAIE